MAGPLPNRPDGSGESVSIGAGSVPFRVRQPCPRSITVDPPQRPGQEWSFNINVTLPIVKTTPTVPLLTAMQNVSLSTHFLDGYGLQFGGRVQGRDETAPETGEHAPQK